MANQLDLDQGGTFRQYGRVWMGPSVGWQTMPIVAILTITAAGTYTIQRWTNLIKIRATSGVINLNLPSSKAAVQGPQAIPGQWVYNPVVIVDLGGAAGGALTVNINPLSPETISSLAQVQLATPYGTVLLEPELTTGGWTLGQ